MRARLVGGCATASNWIATLRGRVGFAADRALFYVTAGGAFTDIKPSTGALTFGGGTEPGWTAGGGVEYAITDNWTAKIEYLYASFQRLSRPNSPRQRARHRDPADSAGLLFFCTIQGLTEALYYGPKQNCRLRLRVPYEAF